MLCCFQQHLSRQLICFCIWLKDSTFSAEWGFLFLNILKIKLALPCLHLYKSIMAVIFVLPVEITKINSSHHGEIDNSSVYQYLLSIDKSFLLDLWIRVLIKLLLFYFIIIIMFALVLKQIDGVWDCDNISKQSVVFVNGLWHRRSY